MICEDTPKSTCSPEWGDGRTPSAALGGMTPAQFGRHLAPANLSARQAKAMDLMMSGTYGPQPIISSRSAALASYAENRLQAATECYGSTLYRLTWKRWVTPSGRPLFLLRASAVRTKGTAHGGSGWPTPRTSDGEKAVRTHTGAMAEIVRKGGPQDLCGASHLAAWITPSARDWKDTPGMTAERTDGKPRNDQLPRQAYMAGWPTPDASGFGADNPGAWMARRAALAEKQGNNGFGLTLGMASHLAAWVTPSARDWRDTPGMSQEAGPNRPSGQPRTDQLLRQTYMATGPARLTASGEMLTGSTARMDGGGQLNPEHARWLMAFPPAWARAAPGWSDYAIWQELMALA
jgi:hypothetical protein